MKTLLLGLCNVLLYMVICLLLATGLQLELRLDEHGLRVLGLSRDDWDEFHLIIALLFTGLSIAHVALNWNWIVGLFRGRLRWPTVIASIIGLVLIAGTISAPSQGDGGNGKTTNLGMMTDSRIRPNTEVRMYVY